MTNCLMEVGGALYLECGTKKNIVMKYCTYLRVSTQKQGRTMLGIDAQRKMCSDFIAQHNGEHAQEFMDVESGTHRDRRGLWDAIEYCKNNGCELVIAKLDRLARDVEFTFKVINTGIGIHFTDMPVVNSMILGVFASVAQYEREMCSSRTKQALQAKKRQGAKLGASSPKYKETLAHKTKEEIDKGYRKRTMTMKKQFLDSEDVRAFCNVLCNVFPNACDKSKPRNEWTWRLVTTSGDFKTKCYALMKDYKELNPSLFTSWDFDGDRTALQVKLAGYIRTLRNSYS